MERKKENEDILTQWNICTYKGADLGTTAC